MALRSQRSEPPPRPRATPTTSSHNDREWACLPKQGLLLMRLSLPGWLSEKPAEAQKQTIRNEEDAAPHERGSARKNTSGVGRPKHATGCSYARLHELLHWIRRMRMRSANTPSVIYKEQRISGLVVEYNVAIVVTRVRFPADAHCFRD